MADKYEIAQLMKHCEEFILRDFKQQPIDETTVMMMLKTAASARQFSKEALAVIIGRAATFDASVLKSANLLALPAKVVNALHFAKHEFSINGPKRCTGTNDDRKSCPPQIYTANVDLQLLQ